MSQRISDERLTVLCNQAWWLVPPHKEVTATALDLRDCRAALKEVLSALFDRCGSVPPASDTERRILDRAFSMLGGYG